MAKQIGSSYAAAPYSVSSLNDGAYFNLIDRLVDVFRGELKNA
jgi:hypothetical protein